MHRSVYVATQCSLLHCECPNHTDLTAPWKWIFGVIFCILGSFGAALGMILQKAAHNEHSAKLDNDQIKCLGIYPQNWKWFAGFTVLVLLPLPLDVAAAALTPQSIVAPLSSITILLAQVMAPQILGEKIFISDWIATMLIVAGCAASTIAGDQCSVDYSLEDVRLLFTHEYFVVSEVFFGFAIVLTTAITLIVIPKYVAEGPRNLTYRALGHGILAGMYGGQQNILLKAFGQSMLRILFKGHSTDAEDWVFWMLLGLTISLATVQISHLNYGMGLIDAVKYLPIYNASLIMNSTFAGLIFYQEYEMLTDAGIVVSVGAWMVILCGVLLLVRPQLDEPGPNPDLKHMSDHGGGYQLKVEAPEEKAGLLKEMEGKNDRLC